MGVFLHKLMGSPEVKPRLSEEHFSVDGTLLQAWASHASLDRIDGKEDPLPPESGPGEATRADSASVTMSSTPTAWSVSKARRFIDTNILVDADDAFDPPKQQLALNLLVDLRTRQEVVLLTQALQDDFVTATRKLGLEAHVARQRAMQFGRFERIQPTLAMLLAAMDLQQNHSLSFWDALIVQTANAARCGVLYSEDMQAGSRMCNVLIVNPLA